MKTVVTVVTVGKGCAQDRFLGVFVRTAPTETFIPLGSCPLAGARSRSAVATVRCISATPIPATGGGGGDGGGAEGEEETVAGGGST